MLKEIFNHKKIGLLALGVLFTTLNVSGQCKNFYKKSCLPQLHPFVHNGQMNSITMYPGESATIAVPFFSGQEYRLLTCAHDFLGDVQFEVKSSDGFTVYNSKMAKSTIWDFNVEETQELTITVSSPEVEKDADELERLGCVGMLIGFKRVGQ